MILNHTYLDSGSVHYNLLKIIELLFDIKQSNNHKKKDNYKYLI